MSNNSLLLVCAALLIYYGLSDLDHFHILYDGFMIFMGITGIVLFFINREKTPKE